MLYRTFTELDLLELRHINRALRAGLKTHEIDMDTILSTFEGHTIFSIYFDNIQVYEQILEQLDSCDFPEEAGLTGNSIENHKLRLLLSILNLPTEDLSRRGTGEDEEALHSLRYRMK